MRLADKGLWEGILMRLGTAVVALTFITNQGNKIMQIKHLPFAIAVISGYTFADNQQELDKTIVESEEDSPTVISEYELEVTQSRDVKDALEQVPGVNVANSLPYAQKIYIRGLEDHSANVTIDGARQDGQLFHHSGTQMVDASMLKAVEVQLGATSALSGYGATTGAIAFQTKDPEDMLLAGERGSLAINTGFDTATEYRRLSVSGYSRLSGNLSALININRSENGDLDIPDSDPIVSKHSEMDSALVKLVYRIGDDQKLRLNLQRYEDAGNRDFSGEKPGSSALEQALGFNGYSRDTYTLDYENNSDNPALGLKASVYRNDKIMEIGASTGPNWYRDQNGRWQVDGTAATPKRDYVYRTTGLDIRNTSYLGEVAWTYGIETFKSEQTIASPGPTIITLESGEQSTRNNVVNNGPEATLMSGYLQADITIGALQLVPGVRYDNYSVGGTYDSSFNKLSPKLNANWNVNHDLTLSMGYGRIFRGPSLPETLFISESLSESTDVAAENGNHLEFRANYDFGEHLGIDQASFFANVYRYNIDNYNHPTRNTQLASSYDVETQGVESGLNIINGKFGFSLSYNYGTGERQYDDYVADVLSTGTHLYKLRANYEAMPGLQLGWDIELANADSLTNRFVDRSGNLNEVAVDKTGYGVNHLWASYTPAGQDNLTLRLAVDNVFNKAYQNHSTFGTLWGNTDYNDNEIGRNLKLSLGYQL